MRRLLCVMVGLVFVACGGSTDTNSSTGGSGGATGGSGGATGGSGGATGGSGGATGGTGGTSPSGCPASAPAGQPCTTPDLRCTYGDSVRPECRNEWICNGGTWVTTKALCLAAPPGECTTTVPTDGTVCTTDGTVCDYPDGTLCLCNACSTGPCAAPPPKWECTPPPTGPGCPAIVPNDGSPCSAPEGTQCTYGIPCGPSGAIATCTNGAWLWEKHLLCGA
jgi:hypothetical protein